VPDQSVIVWDLETVPDLSGFAAATSRGLPAAPFANVEKSWLRFRPPVGCCRTAVVVQSSRVGEGRVVRNNNWYEAGMVVADNLNPQKAAILLSLALTKTSDADDIQRMFNEY
jgi:L-asparaginase